MECSKFTLCIFFCSPTIRQLILQKTAAVDRATESQSHQPMHVPVPMNISMCNYLHL